MEEKSFSLGGIKPFDFMIKYSKMNKYNHTDGIDAHTHSECEIYINLTGDIAFMVEDNIYQVKRGNAIITRPNEWHHCIYNSDAEQRLFWILFSSDGNEAFLDKFFKRKNGEKNLIVLSQEKSEELIDLCYKLLDNKMSDIKRYMYFFELLGYLEDSEASVASNNLLSADVELAIEYINHNMSRNVSIKEAAAHAFVSVKTLERHFIKCLNMSPAEYIRYKRLVQSVEMLREGKSVTEAAMETGFCDTSHFIYSFKKHFKMTPLEYKKNAIK